MLRSAAAKSLRTSSTTASRSILQRRYASHGAPHFNEPSGNLFGEKPLAPGQKRKREDWELMWYIGMFGSMGLAAVGLYYKPDTSINTWAMQEAKQRMEARGESTEYRPS
ncbi:hypothetical protein DL93DRAFT_2057709 [Clavulina sp. PMI_390]|nr:hypothetical protein DL93DRAFT_2057709 [Clavulina sp. PMI_390]